MLFHVTFSPRPGHTHEDQKKTMTLWAGFEMPKGSEIKSFLFGPNAKGYLIVEAESTEQMYEAVAPWAAIYFDYEVVPVIPIDKSLEILQKAVAMREG